MTPLRDGYIHSSESVASLGVCNAHKQMCRLNETVTPLGDYEALRRLTPLLDCNAHTKLENRNEARRCDCPIGYSDVQMPHSSPAYTVRATKSCAVRGPKILQQQDQHQRIYDGIKKITRSTCSIIALAKRCFLPTTSYL